NLKKGEMAYVLNITPSVPREAVRATKLGPTSEATDKKTLEEMVPPEYHDFLDVFSEDVTRELPPHRPYDHAIELEDGAKPPVGRVYNMSETELKALKDYLDDMLGKGFIRASNSP